ncbi:ArsR/SmtB family transcription factor [Streptomyces mirabilis]|uniref:ArsR/SmtB family transcription factor n=1 Tax=Streptomyces mirabilis TaxID=68239 RepID=UPI003806F8F0
MASRSASPLVHPDAQDFDLIKIMSALTDPIRLSIVLTLAARPGLACSGFRQDLTPSVLTRHFRVLREAGVIRQHDQGNRRVNTLRKEELDTRFPGLIDMVLRENTDQITPPGDADCA